MNKQEDEQFYKNLFFKEHNKRLDMILNEIKDMKDNHLSSIYNRLNSLEKRMAYYMGGLAVIIILINIILRYFFK